MSTTHFSVDGAAGVVEITVNKRAGGANGNAGGEAPFGSSAGTELAFGRNVSFSTNIPLRTEGSLIRGHHGSKPSVIRCVGLRHGAERTRDDTCSTPSTEIQVQDHDTVVIQFERSHVTLREAPGLITMHTEQRCKEPPRRLFGFLSNDVERNILGPKMLILASGAAGITTVTFFEVDNESEPRHGSFFLEPCPACICMISRYPELFAFIFVSIIHCRVLADLISSNFPCFLNNPRQGAILAVRFPGDLLKHLLGEVETLFSFITLGHGKPPPDVTVGPTPTSRNLCDM